MIDTTGNSKDAVNSQIYDARAADHLPNHQEQQIEEEKDEQDEYQEVVDYPPRT